MKIQSNARFVLLLAASVLIQPGRFLQAQEAQPPQTKHSLWKVQGKTNAVYLFGSIHFLKKEFYPLPEPIEAAYQKSGIVVFETDIEQMESAESRLKLVQLAKLPQGETLKESVSKETYAMLESYLADTPGVAAALDGFRPWMVAVALLGAELQKLGYDPEQGVDKYFLGKAQKDHKRLVPLETVEFQLSLFGDLSKEEQEAMLKETLREVSRFKKMLADVVRAWKIGDAKELDAFILEEMRGYPQLYKKLLLDRNKRWAEQIEKLLAGDKDVFVVVGAGHLVGKESVSEWLKKKGFSIEQL